METLLAEHWHQTPAEEAAEMLGTDLERGLDPAEVERRRERFGPNALTARKERGPIFRFLLQFHQPLVYILLAAALITALLGEWVDSGVILGVVLVNAIVGFIQEAKALDAIGALARTLRSEATVVRGDVKRRIPSVELVPGDVVLLQSGDKTPADLRLARVRDLRVDESALTGESVPVEKATAPLPRETPLADRRNIAYSTSLVAYGTGVGVVVATGDHTQVGRISQMIASTETLETPLTRKIEQFSRVLLGVILVLAALAFVGELLRDRPAVDAFMAAVALAVAAIPEGLPAAITIMLAIGVSRMARKRAIVRKLPAVETLGSTTVVCSDKTGTLTKNEMTVSEVYAGGRVHEVSGAGYAPTGGFRLGGAAIEPLGAPALAECLRAGLLCNDAVLVEEDGRWGVQGDPTEGALVVAAEKAGLGARSEAEALPRADAVPFESEHQYMATLHPRGGDPAVAYVKGALERLLPRCAAALGGSGEPEPFDPREIEARFADMARRGLRVLLLARKEFPAHKREIAHADLEDGLTLLGLQGMIDPPRPEAAEAVAACGRAGVDVKMITGDHAVTAAAIAAELGIGRRAGAQGAPRVLTGRDLADLSSEALADAAEETSVFARVAPEHKLRLVEALQSRGAVVAMTGDGVNDAPALRRADIGVAMALGGTEVAREASDMVLTDDNFASIVAAVEEGRGVFANLLKFIVWTLPTNGAEALVVLWAVAVGSALPILPVQILWVNMTTAVCLGLMLAFEPKERDLMDRPPRDPGAPLLTQTLVVRILLVSVVLSAGVDALYEWTLARGESEAEARTAAVAGLVFGEAFYLLNCRSLERSLFSVGLFTNPLLWAGIAVMTALQLGFTYLPAANRLFGTAPIGGIEWLAVIALGVAVFVVVGVEKRARRALAASDARRA